MIDEGKINEIIKDNDVFYSFNELISENPLNRLSFNERCVIDEVINNLGDMDSMEISEYSYGDFPWRVADNDEEIDYEFVFYRNPEYNVGYE